MSLSCFTLLLASHPGGHSAFRSLPAQHGSCMFGRRTACCSFRSKPSGFAARPQAGGNSQHGPHLFSGGPSSGTTHTRPSLCATSLQKHTVFR